MPVDCLHPAEVCRSLAVDGLVSWLVTTAAVVQDAIKSLMMVHRRADISRLTDETFALQKSCESLVAAKTRSALTRTESG